MAVKLGDIQLMEAGQPLAFDAKTASKYLKDTCAKHGTVNIYVTIGKGPGMGEWCADVLGARSYHGYVVANGKGGEVAALLNGRLEARMAYPPVANLGLCLIRCV